MGIIADTFHQRIQALRERDLESQRQTDELLRELGLLIDEIERMEFGEE